MLEVIDPPADRIVSLAEMKQHLRVDHTDDDQVIDAYMLAAEGRIDGPWGITGRAFRPQTYRYSIPNFLSSIPLPFPPLIEVVSLDYLDDQGNPQNFAEAGQWRAIGVGNEQGGAIVPLSGVTWPSVLATSDPDKVRVTFTAGYYRAGSPENDAVPPTIKAAVKLMVGDWYEHRTSSVIGTVAGPTPHGVEMLIAPFKIYGAYFAYDPAAAGAVYSEAWEGFGCSAC